MAFTVVTNAHGPIPQPTYVFLNGPTPASFSFIFGLFKQTLLQFLQQINVKNVHPVSSAGIRTHNLLITSFLP